MEYIVEKTQKVKKLSTEEKGSIAKNIVENFKTYDNGRQSQLDKANRLIDEIYFKDVSTKKKEIGKEWKSNLKMCKIFMYSQILKAFIWKNVYANTNSMFDVSGESLEADNNSNKQKTMLVDCLEKMEYAKTCDKIIDDSLVYGELISFTTWKKSTREVRRPVQGNIFNPKAIIAASKGKKFYIDEETNYDNPYIYSVDPANFVFDSTQEDFDSCPKIHRTWKTPEEIINNKYFEVTKEVAEELRGLVKQGSDETDIADQLPKNLKEEYVNGSTVEVLEHWGDLTLKDGTTLKNWYAVVVAGKHLVRFEKNPFIINPFTFGAYIIDPKTKRGVSPLYSIYDIALAQEKMLRNTLDLQALLENPPVFSPQGFFGDEPDDIDVHPGKVIEYDRGAYTNVPVEPMNFNAQAYQDSISYTNDLMSEISGVFPNMAGASENDRTTATEISTKVEGQLTRLKMLLDIINQNLILADVKNVARLKANFTFGDEIVFVNNENNPENVTITDEIRQAEYRYTYADRSATSERFNYADMVGQSIQMFIKAGLAANLNEVFTWYMEQKGVENPERFLQQLDQIDPQVQQALLQNPQLAPVIEEMTNRVQMAKQGQNLPENGTEMPQNEQTNNELVNPSANLQGRNLMG